MSSRRIVWTSLAVACLGLVGLAIGLGVEPTRAWFAYLNAWLFGTSIAVGGLLLNMTGHAAKAGWMVMTRRPTEAIAGTLPLLAILFVPLAFGLGHIYPWATHPTAGGPIEAGHGHHPIWLSRPFFIARTAVYFLIFCTVSQLLRTWSKANDVRPSLVLVQRMRRLGGGGLPLIALTLTWASFDWSMSLQPDWYSTMFGFYFFAGSYVGAIGLTCVVLRLSRPKGTLAIPVTPDQSQALGRVLFAMIIFWAYISFGQLLIYWIGDIPEEVSYYAKRTVGSWTAVTYVIVFGHFVVPFLILLNRKLKRHVNAMAVAGGWIFIMHFVDVYWQVLPVYDVGGAKPDWLDFVAIAFVGGLSCAFVVRRYLAAAPVPVNAPELADGLHYEAAV